VHTGCKKYIRRYWTTVCENWHFRRQRSYGNSAERLWNAYVWRIQYSYI